VNLENLASIPDEVWMDYAPNSIGYSTNELATKEAKDTFAELYTLVGEKAYGMDGVLDEIIASDTDQPPW